MSTAVMWFRRDLRVRDLPALLAACEADAVVPLFVFDRRLLAGRFRSANRTSWMLGCLDALDAALRERGGALVVRVADDPVDEVRAVAAQVGATAVHISDDVTAFARRRDARAEAALAEDGVILRRHPGLWCADLDGLRTKDGRPFAVYSPFFRAWKVQPRRPVLDAPRRVPPAGGIDPGRLPAMTELGFEEPPVLVERPEPGEPAGLAAAWRFLRGGFREYAEMRDTLSWTSSRLSAYLRYGCVSPRWLEEQVLDGDPRFRGEVAWRDFYAAVQLHFPFTARLEYREALRALEWDEDPALVEAWKEGRTGYPVVDAGMRQLEAMGWMHNRARMLTGSFLVKDLQQDWRIGEAHFMHHLLDGDVASNNGGWQWVASTGTDPAPFFQRLFNPMLQQERFDPDGSYVRRWVPELADVPLEHLARPWEWIGFGALDYPEPIVDHKAARERAIERYRAATG